MKLVMKDAVAFRQTDRWFSKYLEHQAGTLLPSKFEAAT
jgi:hypothetical protein